MLLFDDLYEDYAADVYRFAYWLCGDRAKAEDITSETFLRAWAHNTRIQTETLKAYLFTIARNVFLHGQRKDKRQVALYDVIPDSAPSPEQAVESRLEIEHIARVLRRFPECDRSAFIMRVQHELPYNEIARVLEITPAAARVKVHRMRKRLLRYRVKQEVS
jgi:RNA polymerase sigma-70 factor (ECF subfamily)